MWGSDIQPKASLAEALCPHSDFAVGHFPRDYGLGLCG